MANAPRNGKPAQYPASINVRISLELAQELDHYATEYGLSTSDLARMAIKLGISPAVTSIEDAIEAQRSATPLGS